MNTNCLYADHHICCAYLISFSLENEYQQIYSNAQIPVPQLLLLSLNAKQDGYQRKLGEV